MLLELVDMLQQVYSNERKTVILYGSVVRGTEMNMMTVMVLTKRITGKNILTKNGNRVRTDMEKSAFINRGYCTYSGLRYNRSRACTMVLAALCSMGIPKI